MCRWKNCENWSIFSKDMDKNIVSPFFWLTVYNNWRWAIFKINSEANCNGQKSVQQQRRTIRGEELDRKNSRNEWCKFWFGVWLDALGTWTLRNDDVTRLEACEMWIWRKTENMSWLDHITNEQVLMMVDEQRSLIDAIHERQKNLVHVFRKTRNVICISDCRILDPNLASSPYTFTVNAWNPSQSLNLLISVAFSTPMAAARRIFSKE